MSPTTSYSSLAAVFSSAARLAWIRPDSIGDGVLASTMLPLIKARYPQLDITVVCQERLVELYRHRPDVGGVVGCRCGALAADESYRNELIKRLEGLQADIALNSVYSRNVASDFLTLATAAPYRIGLQGSLENMLPAERDANNRYYTHILEVGSACDSELNKHIKLLHAIGVETVELKPDLAIPCEAQALADRFLNDVGVDPKGIIALFAGAQVDVRIYERYGEALSDLCRTRGFTVVALGGTADAAINQLNLESIKGVYFNLSGRTTLFQAAALIRRCRLAVGAETGLAHIACAVGTPNVILLGGGHFGRFMPYSPLTTVACLPLECFGCNWGCRYGFPYCVKAVAPQVLKAAIAAALEGEAGRPRIFAQESFAIVPGMPAPRVIDPQMLSRFGAVFRVHV